MGRNSGGSGGRATPMPKGISDIVRQAYSTGISKLALSNRATPKDMRQLREAVRRGDLVIEQPANLPIALGWQTYRPAPGRRFK